MSDTNSNTTPEWWVQVALIGLYSISLSFQTSVLFGMDGICAKLALFLYSGTLFGYHWSAKHCPTQLLAWLMGAVAGVAWLLLDWSTRCAVFGPALGWAFYFGLQHPRATGLRGSAWLKPLSIAFTWAWVTVWLPLPFGAWLEAVPMLFERAAFIFALALAYDLHDRKEDFRAGLNTLVRELGATGAFRLMDAAWLMAATAAFVGFLSELYAWQTVAVLCAHFLFSRFVLRQLHRYLREWPWHKICIDGLMLLQTVAVYASV